MSTQTSDIISSLRSLAKHATDALQTSETLNGSNGAPSPRPRS